MGNKCCSNASGDRATEGAGDSDTRQLNGDAPVKSAAAAQKGSTELAEITVDLYNPPVDPQAPLNARDIDIVQQTFARVSALGAETVGMVLFMNIFDIAPGAVDLFPFRNDPHYLTSPVLRSHATKVVSTVATAVSMLKDVPALVPVLQELGAKHVGYLVKPEHYDVVGQALIKTLGLSLGKKFTDPCKKAWLKVWGIWKNTMICDNYN